MMASMPAGTPARTADAFGVFERMIFMKIWGSDSPVYGGFPTRSS